MKRQATKILLPAALVLAAACSPPNAAPPPLPGLALATDLEAQAMFRPLLKRWGNALTREERALVGNDLRTFLERYPEDGQAPAAEALLAWVAIDWGDLVTAKQRSRRAHNLGPGSWQDFSFVIDGAIRRRNGEARAALEILAPLVGGLIDPWARDLLNEEVITAAVAAGDSGLAVKTMSIWLREAGDEESMLVRARVQRALRSIPDADVIRIFDTRTARPGADDEIFPLLVERVARIALDTRDAILAKKLLATSGSLLGSRGDDIARLAAGAAVIRIDARTVGLLLSFRTSATRSASAEVAAGVTWGLGLPGSGARLAVRTDAGDPENIDDALTELGRDGAAVIIAGIADEDARAAAQFAGQQRVPVILIHRPPDVPVFLLTPAGLPTATPPPVSTLTVSQPAPTATVAPQGSPQLFAVSLGISATGYRPAADNRYGGWIATYGGTPSFWSAAGRDAAVLALRSVKDLPQATTEDLTEVAARRRTVRDALTQPVPEVLWTIAVDDEALGTSE
ncbi:MAG: hypothetical protein R3F14_16605 [Polyangiaceae bacterium]